MNLIRGLLSLAVIGLLIFNPVTLGIVGGIFAGQGLQDRARDGVRAQVYKTSCAQYKEATTWERWTSYYGWKMGWCEEYLDRM
ncbi:hypothetical protein [Agrobacterium tumefaciens]|uniref:hypothetical protein n=1 Tax=Agrobacterium tumefaciens TaxID=358 RepID=UPI0015723ECC|nr:hypothetical protein [Agrobacterium tumefaciens]